MLGASLWLARPGEVLQNRPHGKIFGIYHVISHVAALKKGSMKMTLSPGCDSFLKNSQVRKMTVPKYLNHNSLSHSP